MVVTTRRILNRLKPMISQPEGDDGGMDSMYPSEGATTPSEKTTPETVDEETEDSSSKTALVPKKMCGSCKVGDTMKMRVVKDYGDEVELECCSDSEEDSKEEMSSDEEIDAMDKG